MARKRKRTIRKRRPRSRRYTPKRRYYRRPRRKRSASRRRYRSNPPAVMSVVQNTLYAVGGFTVTKFLGNTLTPMISNTLPLDTQPLVRIAFKGFVAYLSGWLAEQMLGRRYFMPVFLGGAAEVVQEVHQTYLAPNLPGFSGMGYNGRTALGSYSGRSMLGRYNAGSPYMSLEDMAT